MKRLFHEILQRKTSLHIESYSSKKNCDLVIDCIVVVSSDFVGICSVEEKASQPLPISMICRGGSMVTTDV